MRAVVFYLLLLPVAMADTSQGTDWLSTNANADGSIAGPDDIATAFQATSEALNTFELIQAGQAVIPPARDYILNEPFQNTEYLTRQIKVAIDTDDDPASLIAKLSTHQNNAGGFGDQEGYDSTVLDTAFAAEALALAGQATSQSAGFAISYLLSNQNADGGWSYNSVDSSTYITAITAGALWRYRNIYNLDTVINNAVDYLLDRRGADQLWSETFISALALITLVNNLEDLNVIAESLSGLRNQQLSNGSWENDVYTTALALRALKLAESPPANPGLSSISGNVVDGQTGLALAGVNINLTGPSSKAITTGSNGAFLFQDVAAGSYTLELTKPDYDTLTANTVANPGQAISFGTLQMLQAGTATTATIRGTVTEAVTGGALEGVAVSVTGVAGSVQTDTSGNFLITNVSPGDVTVQAILAGYSTATAEVSITAGGIFVFSPGLTPVSNPTTALKGTVTDGGSGQPLAGVEVSITGSTTSATNTDANGEYFLSNLNPGDIAIEVSLAGYDTVIAGATVFENNILVFSPALYPENTTPPGSNTAGVTGIVVDSTTNLPLENVTVTATFGTTVIISTDATGRFTLTDISVLEGTLEFALEEYVSATFGATLIPLVVSDIGQVRLRPEDAEQILPDLAVDLVDATATTTDTATLEYSGDILVDIFNEGTATAISGVEALAFYDVNKNGMYETGLDTFLGTANTLNDIAPDTGASITIPVSGFLPYRDAPVSVWVDSLQSVIETDELNNVNISSNLCQVVPEIGNFEPVLKWEWTGSPLEPAFNQVIATPVVVPLYDTNNDGIIDSNDEVAIIFHSYAGNAGAGNPAVLRAISGVDGSEIWSITDPALRTEGYSSLAAGDIDGDGFVEIIAGRSGGGTLCFEHTGDLKWSSTHPARAVFWGGASIADLDQSGTAEIIIGNLVLNNDGQLLWQGSGYDGSNFALTGPLSIVTDIDLDGTQEVIAGPSAYSSDGIKLWENTSLDGGFAAVGNFNNDEYPEIVLVISGTVYLLNNNGDILWGSVPIPGGGRGGPPTIADVDGDGKPEIGVAAAVRYTVLDTDGSVLWSVPVQDASSSMTGSSVFDFDGDGRAEVVYADELFLRIYEGATGTVLFEISNTSGTTNEYPLVADVDRDNHAEIVVVSNQLLQRLGRLPGPGINGVRVYEDINDAWVSTRSVWNQHTYHIDNINEDGTIPVTEEHGWLTHNSYRLNTFPDRDPLLTSDLTAARLTLSSQGNGFLQLTVLVGNAGTVNSPPGTQVSFFEGDPGISGTLIGSVDLPVLQPDSAQLITLNDIVSLTGNMPVYALVDSEGTVLECNEDNNTVQIAAPDLKPDLIVGSIDISNTVFNEQSLEISGELSAVITNQGTVSTGTGFDVVVFVDSDQDGSYDAGIDTQLGLLSLTDNLNLGASEEVSVPVTGLLPFRDFPVSVTVDAGETVDEDNEENNVATTAVECMCPEEPATTDGELFDLGNWAVFREAGGHAGTAVWTLSSNKTAATLTGNAAPSTLTSDFEFADGRIAGTLRTIGSDDDFIGFVWGYQDAQHYYRFMWDLGNCGCMQVHLINSPEPLYESVGVGDQLLYVNNIRWQRSVTYDFELDYRPGHTQIIIKRGETILDTILIEDDTYTSGKFGFYNYSQHNTKYSAYPIYVSECPVGGDTTNDTDIVVPEGYSVELYAENVTGQQGPAQIAIDSHDNLYIALGGSGAAVIPAGSNQVISFGDTSPSDSDGIAVDSQDNVIVGGGPVTKYAPDGSVIWARSCPIGNIQRVAVDQDDNIYVGSLGSSICKISPDNSTMTIFGGFNRPSDPFVGPDGSLYVWQVGASNFVKFDGDTGQVLDVVISGITGSTPLFDGPDRILAGGSSAIKLVNVPEQTISSFASGFGVVDGLAFNSAGDLLVGDDQTKDIHRIYKIDSSLPDLTASRLQVIDNGAGLPLSVRVRIGNAGQTASPDNVIVSIYDSDPVSGGSLLGSGTVDMLVPYEYQDVLVEGITLPAGITGLYAFVDSDEQVIECNETNNITRADIPGSIQGQIIVATDALIYAPNTDVVLQSVTTNTGSLTGAFLLDLFVEDLDGVVITSFTDIDTGTLTDGAGFNHNESWNTATYIAGTYRLHGVLSLPDGTVIDEAFSDFEIRHDDTGGVPSISLRTTTDKATYHTTDTVLIDDLVRNLTISTLVRDASLHLVITEPGSTEVFTVDIELGDLVPSGTQQRQTVFNLVGALQGQYTVTGEVHDVLGNVLAQDSAQFVVEEDLYQSLVGNITAQLEILESGETQVCTDTLSNQGTLAITALPVRQLLVNIDTEEESNVETLSVDLAAGESLTHVRSIDTHGLVEGFYACVIQVQLDGEWQTLAFDNFELLPPPIEIDGLLKPGDRGRLLILLDPHDELEPDNDQDPFGPDDMPSLTAQREYLETLLSEAGWSYTIVETAEDFSNELAGGGYLVYAIFSETVKLDKPTQELLVAEVAGGDGFLAAGLHDRRNKHMEEALGLDIRGNNPKAVGINVEASDVSDAWSSPDLLDDKVQSFQPDTAQVIGFYDVLQGNNVNQENAVSYTLHGNGRSVFAGFDLVLQSAWLDEVLPDGSLPEENVYARFLLDALDAVHPETIVTSTGSVIPVKLSLNNIGIATPGQVILDLPDGLVMVDAAGFIQLDPVENTWLWTFDLGLDESVEITFYVRLPESIGDVELSALIQAGSDGVFIDLDTLFLIIDVVDMVP